MQSQAIDFHPPVEEAPAVLLPVTATLFADRAERFATLAEGHSLGDWLTFLGRLSAVQQSVLNALPDLPMPDAASVERARTHRMPLFDPAQRPPAWRDALRDLARALSGQAPAAAQHTLADLLAADDARLEQLASLLLDGEPQAADIAALPFVAAALQVVFTRQASQCVAAGLQLLDAPNLCPCCGSPAVAGVVRLGASINNLRYLHCSLCNSEWNVPRATCTHCGGDKELTLNELEGGKGSVRAETCGSCKSYLKMVYQEKDPRVDPVADDLASLALDLLVDEAGYERAGPNLLLIGAHSG